MVTPEQTSRALARAVAEALAEAGVSQRKAAEATGIPLTTLSRRLTGASPLLATELASLASLLGITVSALAIAAEGSDAA
jgi:transcriptional regulator with XRE-family HTH domain